MGKKEEKKLTPMMRQYLDIRSKLSDDTLLFFRLGDFYEMFNEDAEISAKILGINLTQRHGIPMAGIPYHASEQYIAKLLKHGKKVAICDQVEDPKPGKLVERSLTRILTPGTLIEEQHLQANKSHYLLGLNLVHNSIAAAWLDLTTGEFKLAQEDDQNDLMPILSSLDPKEVLVPENFSTRLSLLSDEQKLVYKFIKKFPTTELSPYAFDEKSAYKLLLDTLGVANLNGFGIREDLPALGVAGALIQYASETLCQTPKNLHAIKLYSAKKNLLLDPSTQSNLEIFKSSAGSREGSLLHAIDRTTTAQGARLLEKWLAEPIIDKQKIQNRQNIVKGFKEEPSKTKSIQKQLNNIKDLQRLLSRLENKLKSPRELGSIRDTLATIPNLKDQLSFFDEPSIQALSKDIHTFETLSNLLSSSLKTTLPVTIKDGNYIHCGFDEKLDYLRDLMRKNRSWLIDLEREEQERTGIKNLKIKYNNAFGYFIEVTKSNVKLVPCRYIRKQTMTNAERYYTEELKQKENEILTADIQALDREKELLAFIIESILKESEQLRKTSYALSKLDVLVGWSMLARDWQYCCPAIDESKDIEISEGRHAVVEQFLRNEHSSSSVFVANNTELQSHKNQIALITGPNMAGKSTYIRQVALIVLMAQIGCFVPAKACRIGLVDKIFSRIGANDDLAKGNSTFMVEMNETANIINNSTANSLIILDEIGRGTSTYDGLSIAWAVVEHLHGQNNHGPKTLFATHYHELTQLEGVLDRLHNYAVAVKEWNDEIIFVRQVNKGASNRSYGIQVAKLAGLPNTIIERSKLILNELEKEGKMLKKVLRSKYKNEQTSIPQLNLHLTDE